MELKRALEIVLEMAATNMIKEKDIDIEELNDQEKAWDLVTDLYDCYARGEGK